MRKIILVLSFVTFVILLQPGLTHAQSEKLWGFTPEIGFIDDAMAFDANGKQFAYIHTDSAKFLKIQLLSLDGFKELKSIEVADAARVPHEIAFTLDGASLIFVWADSYTGKQGAMLFDIAKGNVLKEIKPYGEIQIMWLDEKQTLVQSDLTTDTKGVSKLEVTTYNSTDFKKLKNTKLTISAGLTSTKPPLRVLFWGPGHITLTGMQKGEYDRKKDIRLPDRAVRYNILTKKQVWSLEPNDLVEWSKVTNMRPNYSTQTRFLHVSEDLKTLHYVDTENHLLSVTTPIDWSLYEPKSLSQTETWDQKTLYFSMTIDPVNPAAVKRKKADKERMDLYLLDAGPKAIPLGQVLTDNRRFAWTVGTTNFSYLKKLKGFGRGGKELAIYKIGKK